MKINRRAFLKLCGLALPAFAILSKIPVVKKLAPKLVLPPDTGPKPLISWDRDDSDTGLYRVNNQVRFIVEGKEVSRGIIQNGELQILPKR